jgi:hypothetical protein
MPLYFSLNRIILHISLIHPHKIVLPTQEDMGYATLHYYPIYIPTSHTEGWLEELANHS